jgi:hypothetical protein
MQAMVSNYYLEKIIALEEGFLVVHFYFLLEEYTFVDIFSYPPIDEIIWFNSLLQFPP